jgi:hypothetical protein
VTDHLAVASIQIEVGPIDMWYSSAVAIGRDLGAGEDCEAAWRVHVPAQTQFRGPTTGLPNSGGIEPPFFLTRVATIYSSYTDCREVHTKLEQDRRGRTHFVRR